MHIVNIHEAKTNLSRLIAMASQGEPFVIAKAGQPLVTVTAIPPAVAEPRTLLGFMKGTLRVPDDFDRMGGDAVAALIEGDVA